MDRNLADQLYFAKEAADYLGISVQRLNKLVLTGRIQPLKKSGSGTIFLLSELEKRKKELSIFSDSYSPDISLGDSFRIDSALKQEAVNFSVIQSMLGVNGKKLEPLFDSFSEIADVSVAIPENSRQWADCFNLDQRALEKEYSRIADEFMKLREDDVIIKRGNPDYPKLLSATEEAPRFLYLRGIKGLLYDSRTVSLVGSREASEEGKANTARVAKALGRNGIIIVSGLAKGIDAAAHRAAIDNGYDTIAVIGTNLNQYYPAENRELQAEIERKGLVISQFAPGIKTERWFFPMRNGVMSGLSLATVIMEAGETSGSLKQATFALKQKRLVLIPRNAFRIASISWPARLEAKGAIPVNTPQDIIERLTDSSVFIRDDSHMPDLFDDSVSDGLYIADSEGVYCAGKK